MDEVERILGPGGAAETFLKARDEGKVRYLGCSAHSEEAALAMLDRFKLDSILFPINFVTMTQANFGPRVITKAKEKGAARLALKALALTRGQARPTRAGAPIQKRGTGRSRIVNWRRGRYVSRFRRTSRPRYRRAMRNSTGWRWTWRRGSGP